MLDGILTPAFLQAASANRKETYLFKALVENPTITEVTCRNLVAKTFVQGVETTTEVGDLSTQALALTADNDSVITLIGNLIINVLGNEVQEYLA